MRKANSSSNGGAAWEKWDETGDLSVIADHLAEDVVVMPDGESPIAGKENVTELRTKESEMNTQSAHCVSPTGTKKPSSTPTAPLHECRLIR